MDYHVVELLHDRLLFYCRATAWLTCSSVATTISCGFLLTSALLRPFSRRLAFYYNCAIAEVLWSLIQRIFADVHHAVVTVSGDHLPEQEGAIVIANHTSYSDFYLVHALAGHAGMLGRCRYFAKNALRYVPILGWAMLLCDMIMVRRNWQTDRRQMDKMFDGIRKYKLSMWLITYVEGTRFTKRKAGQSQAWARATGRKELEHCLSPRHRGFAMTVKALRDSHINYVYDLTLAYRDRKGRIQHAPTPIETHGYGRISDMFQFHVHVRRYALDTIPAGEDGAREWLEERWSEKDKLLDGLAREWLKLPGLGPIRML